MTKEKFDRSKEHVNIGEIGKTKEDQKHANYILERVQERINKDGQRILRELISQYGEEKGKELYEAMLREASETWANYQELDMNLETKENSSLSLRR